MLGTGGASGRASRPMRPCFQYRFEQGRLGRDPRRSATDRKSAPRGARNRRRLGTRLATHATLFPVLVRVAFAGRRVERGATWLALRASGWCSRCARRGVGSRCARRGLGSRCARRGWLALRASGLARAARVAAWLARRAGSRCARRGWLALRASGWLGLRASRSGSRWALRATLTWLVHRSGGCLLPDLGVGLWGCGKVPRQGGVIGLDGGWEFS